jgi:hypothetical protein
MDEMCTAPRCELRATTTLRNEVPVCVEHYRQARTRLEQLGVDLSRFNGQIRDLLRSEEVWETIAAALTTESTLLQKHYQQHRQDSEQAIEESLRERPPKAESGQSEISADASRCAFDGCGGLVYGQFRGVALCLKHAATLNRLARRARIRVTTREQALELLRDAEST